MKQLLITFFAFFACFYGMTNIQSNFKEIPTLCNENDIAIQKLDVLSNEQLLNKSINNCTNFFVIGIDSLKHEKNNMTRVSLAKKFAEKIMHIWPDSFALNHGGNARWSYGQGFILRGIESLWNATGDAQYFSFIQYAMDNYVKEDGSIYNYKSDDLNTAHLNFGKILLTLYQVTGKEKYKKAIDQLRHPLLNRQRNTLDSFWNKKILPNQMWLDDVYMGAAFYAQWAAVFHDTLAYKDITTRFILIEKLMRDDKSGLYHALDEGKHQKLTESIYKKSPHRLASAMGLFGTALVDALDYYPANHPGKDALIQILQRWSLAILKVQDPKDGVWFDMLDASNNPRNFKEAASSSMFTFILQKAMRKGYISINYFDQAQKAYAGLLSNFVINDKGQLNLLSTVSVSGLGGNLHRDANLDDHVNEAVSENHPKAMGAFLQATVESEFNHVNAKQPVVLLDAFYNNEIKKDVYGHDTRWHYAWEDISNGGFGMLAKQFESKGAQLKTLLTAPSASNLSKAAVYIIVDPDNYKDNPAPNYMNDLDATVISNWVKNGGILVMLANDSANCDLVHFNQLSEKFGIQFTNQSINMVKGDFFEMGAAFPVQPNEVLKPGTKIFVKDISAIKLTGTAKAIAVSNDQVVAAIAKYGKGKVIAIGDPWLYNEYVDGRKLPISFQNFDAMQQLVNWTLSKPQ